MNRLEGKVAIITGASSGIGEATALLFSQEGAKVILVDRQAELLETVVEKMNEGGGEATAIPGDISDSATATEMVNKAMEKYGKLDILANIAGVVDEGILPIDKAENRVLDNVLNVNTKGVFYCTREALKAMLPAKSGSIINISSIAGLKGFGGSAYSASKGAVIAITLHTALRAAKEGIRCNVICPGTTITPMITGPEMAIENLDQDMMGAMQAHGDLTLPVCFPNDIANVILFLSSDESKCITGQTIVTDFGLSL